MIGYLEILVSRVTDVEHKWIRAPSTKALTYLTLLSPSPSVESEVERSSLHLEHEHPVTLASLFSLQTVSSGTWRCSILPQDFLKMNEIKSTKPSLLFGEQGDEGNRKDIIKLNYQAWPQWGNMNPACCIWGFGSLIYKRAQSLPLLSLHQERVWKWLTAVSSFWQPLYFLFTQNSKEILCQKEKVEAEEVG